MGSLTIESGALSSTASLPLSNGGMIGKGTRSDKEPELYCAGEVRLLILDDDPGVCGIIQTALANPDFTVDMVSDPGMMETQLREKKYHVVILDYVIPGIKFERLITQVRDLQSE